MTAVRSYVTHVLAAIGSLALANAAYAADLKAPLYKALISPTPAMNWTGFYVGGHVGSGWGTTETDADIGAAVNAAFPNIGLGLNVPIAQHSINGFLGGAQAGYNWQSGAIVYGLEGDFSWSGMKGGTACVLILHCDAKVNWMADLTGRVGVTISDRGLLYVKGGVAWADSKYLLDQTVSLGAGPGVQAGVHGEVSATRVGGVLGAGVEYGFMPNWTAKLEYDYFDFGKVGLNMPIRASGSVGGAGGAVSFTVPITVVQQLHTVRVGANYHF